MWIARNAPRSQGMFLWKKLEGWWFFQDERQVRRGYICLLQTWVLDGKIDLSHKSFEIRLEHEVSACLTCYTVTRVFFALVTRQAQETNINGSFDPMAQLNPQTTVPWVESGCLWLKVWWKKIDWMTGCHKNPKLWWHEFPSWMPRCGVWYPPSLWG